MAVLRDKYNQEIVPQLREQYKYKSPMQMPRLSKIVLEYGSWGGYSERKDPGLRSGRVTHD